MMELKYEIQRTTQFKKDLKLAKKRGCDIEKLQSVLLISFFVFQAVCIQFFQMFTKQHA